MRAVLFWLVTCICALMGRSSMSNLIRRRRLRKRFFLRFDHRIPLGRTGCPLRSPPAAGCTGHKEALVSAFLTSLSSGQAYPGRILTVLPGPAARHHSL